MLNVCEEETYQTLSKALDVSSATDPVAFLSGTLAILSATTVRRFAVDREELKPYWKSEIISRHDQEAYHL